MSGVLFLFLSLLAVLFPAFYLLSLSHAMSMLSFSLLYEWTRMCDVLRMLTSRSQEKHES